MPEEPFIPVLGGLALIVGSGLTIFVDRLERLRDASTPRPVLYRFFSQAILAMHQWPHWIFLCTANVFAPCIFLTSAWQAARLENECTDPDCASLSRAFIMDGTLTAVCFYLDAWIPLGRPIITHISHTLVAVGFFVFGTHYVYNTILLAKLLPANDTNAYLVFLRTVCLGTMLVAGVVVAMTTSPAVHAHGRLLNHQFRGTRESQMEQDDILKCRRLEACMSTAQMVLGIGLGLTLFTSFIDVMQVMDSVGDINDLPYARWGRPMFWSMLCMTLLEYVFRDSIYRWCQAMLLRFRVSEDTNKLMPKRD